MKKTIKRGDYFLLPYAGEARDRLVVVEARSRKPGGWWRCRFPELGGSFYLSDVTLELARRISAYQAKRIIAAAKRDRKTSTRNPGSSESRLIAEAQQSSTPESARKSDWSVVGRKAK